MVFPHWLRCGDVGGAYYVFKRFPNWFSYLAVGETVKGCGWTKVGGAAALCRYMQREIYAYSYPMQLNQISYTTMLASYISYSAGPGNKKKYENNEQLASVEHLTWNLVWYIANKHRNSTSKTMLTRHAWLDTCYVMLQTILYSNISTIQLELTRLLFSTHLWERDSTLDLERTTCSCLRWACNVARTL